MVNYDVDTEPRLRIYVGLLLLSVFGARNVAKGYAHLAEYLNEEYLTREFFVTLPTSIPITVTPLVIFGISLWIFDRFLWRWPLISRVSGIPDLEGTWKGTLSRTWVEKVKEEQVEKHEVRCFITQTWRKIDLVLIDFGPEGPTRVGTTRIVGMFVENPQDIYVRFVYAARQTTMLRHLDDVNVMPSEGAGILRLRRWSEGRFWQRRGKKRRVYLQGTYHSDKMRRGDIDLERYSGRRPTEEHALVTPNGEDDEERRRGSQESEPSDDVQAPRTCTEVTQQGANVTTTTHKGNCDSNGGQEETTPSKSPPGTNKG
jgi:hypothetical protein